MHEWKEGKLHVGKSNKIVTSQKQAIAIALNQSGLSNRKKKSSHRKDAASTPKVSLALKQIINSVYRDGVDAVLSYDSDATGGISGLFRDGREVFNYAIAPTGQISYVEVSDSRKDAYLEGYYLAGRVPDCSISNAYTRSVLNVELDRLDSNKKPRKCSSGKSCGNTCIAKGLKCVALLGQREQLAVKQISETIKTQKNRNEPPLDTLKRHAPIIAGVAGAGILGAAVLGMTASQGRTGAGGTTLPAPSSSPPGSPPKPQYALRGSASRSPQKSLDPDNPWDGPEPDPWDEVSPPPQPPATQSRQTPELPPGIPQPKPQVQSEKVSSKPVSSNKTEAAKDILFNKNKGHDLVGALDIQGFDENTSSKLGHVVNQIKNTVNIPNLAKIPVQPTTDSTKDGEYFTATYANRKTGEIIGCVPTKIELNSSNRPELALVHEVGHFVHHTAIGDSKNWDKEKVKPEMQELFNVVNSSKAIKNLDRLTRIARRQDVRERANYLNQPEEIFARMFTQYVAKKSGSKVLQAQVKAGQKGKAVEYWDDREFSRVIEPAMDKFCKDMGWRNV